MNTKIEIPFSRLKAALPIIFLLIISFTGLLAFLSPETLIANTNENTDRIGIIGLATAGITLVLAIVFVFKWLTKKTGLIIDHNGITDISNASYTGLVEWNDITKIEGKKVGPIKLIILHTNNPEKYINQAKKTAIRQLRKNLSFYGSPLLIVSSRLNIKYEELFDTMTKAFNNSKNATA
jgi:hypothetical protein